MQRFGLRKGSEWGRCYQRWQRCHSGLAQQAMTDNSEAVHPRMPHFDYSPPPYTGPNIDQILKKRKEFLSPSMFYFYKEPVSTNRLITK